jgi:hypothetical protein
MIARTKASRASRDGAGFERRDTAENPGHAVRRLYWRRIACTKVEYMLVYAIDQGDEAWIEVYAGIDIIPRR